MEYEKERQEQRRIKRRRKLRNISIVVIILLSLLGIAINYNVLVQWTIPVSVPSTTLIHPANHEVINNNTTYFSWNTIGGEGPLAYVWYADVTNTFISPFSRTVSVGAIDNYTTAPPFDDGKWYWRVEVSDGTSTNVTDVWDYFIKSNATNNFPSLTFPLVTPVVGGTNTNFVYSVNYTDADNTTPSYVRVYIDGLPHDMVEIDITDTNISNGKTYIYDTLLTTGTHDYFMICSDGMAINSTGLFNDPTVTQEGVPQTPPEKMNKVTISPNNIVSNPSETFTGKLVITEENSTGEYEVFWYLELVKTDGTVISLTSGAVAIITTVEVVYSLLVPLNASFENYQLVAKTYDAPREQPVATQLGMDSITVSVEEESDEGEPAFPGSDFLLKLIDDFINFLLSLPWLCVFALCWSIILPLLAFKKKRGWLLAMGTLVLFFMLILFSIIEVQLFSILGLLLLLIGGLSFSEYGPKMIKNQNLRMFVGFICLFLGVMLFLGFFTTCLWVIK